LQLNNLLQNGWRGFDTIFNSPITYQILQPIEEELVKIVAQTDVEEVNRSTNGEIQQSTQTGSPNVDHKYQEPIEELNMLLLNTPKNIVNAFGTID